MRIGILTLNTHTNYGGILQAFALSRVLQSLGHEPKVIYLPVRRKLPAYKYPFVIAKRAILKLLGHQNRIFLEDYLNKVFLYSSKNTQLFIDKYIPNIVVHNYVELKECDWDSFVVGSDQVWRPLYMGKNIANAFLQFAKEWNIFRIAYAASFGVDTWEYTHEIDEKCGRLLRKFDAVSVREESGVRLCKEHWDVEAVHMIDPTFLLPLSVYESLMMDYPVGQTKGDLLCYILDKSSSKDAFVERVATMMNLVPFQTNSKYEEDTATLEECIQAPVEQWLYNFTNAKLIVTDSFHACAFSIMFNKPFVVIANKERGATRIKSLLKMFGLEKRMVSDKQPIDSTILEEDWNIINNKISQYRKSAFDYIEGVLN